MHRIGQKDISLVNIFNDILSKTPNLVTDKGDLFGTITSVLVDDSEDVFATYVWV